VQDEGVIAASDDSLDFQGAFTGTPAPDRLSRFISDNLTQFRGQPAKLFEALATLAARSRLARDPSLFLLAQPECRGFHRRGEMPLRVPPQIALFVGELAALLGIHCVPPKRQQ